MQSIPAASLEYVLVSVTANVNGAPYNPTVDSVQFAFPPAGSAPTTWYAGSWDSNPVPGTSTYTAKCLVGPGGTTQLVAGSYAVYVKITDNPEIPVRQAGLLAIT